MIPEDFYRKLIPHLADIPRQGTLLFWQPSDRLQMLVYEARPDIRQTEHAGNNSADAVFLGTVLTSAPDLEDVFFRLRRVLRYGGPVFALIAPWDPTEESLQVLVRLFAATGFESIAVEVIGNEEAPAGWLVKASYMDEEERRLLKGISREGCAELAHLLCRVENDMDPKANAERILALCAVSN